MKRALWVVIALALGAGAAWIFRTELALQAVGVLAQLRTPTGPHQDVAWSTAVAPVADRARPNVILIVADDLGWNDITLNGGGVAGGTVPTPNIDSIAAQGVTFSNGYAAFSSCAPSRAALLSGRYPTRFGFAYTPTPPGMAQMLGLMTAESRDGRPPVVWHADVSAADVPDFAHMGMPASEVTLAETLRDAGYHTAHIGKWHLGNAEGMAPQDQGFAESLLMASGMYLPEDDPGVVNAKQDFDPIDRFLWKGMRYAASFNGSPAFEPGGYLTDYYTDEAVKVIENNRDRPFFLYLAHWAPHTPLQATREDYEALSHIESHRERVYAAMIRALDRGVGRVLQALRDNGIDDNTLVIFTSDNGGAGYIGIDDVNSPYRGYKLQLFEGGIHVPFMMRWPGHIAPGTVVDDPVQHFDIYTTAATAAGAAVDQARVDGVDLLPYSNAGARPATPPHASLFWINGEYQAMRSGDWKLQVSQRPATIRLYDLASDPTERRNVAADHPERVQQMQAALAAHVAQQPPPAWPAQAEMPVRIDKHDAQPWSADDEYVYVTN